MSSQSASDPERELRRLRQVVSIERLADELIEEALREKLSLEAALERLLPAVVSAAGASSAFLRSYDEDIKLRTFTWPQGSTFPALEEILQATDEGERHEVAFERRGVVVAAQPLDVAGEWFGAAGFAFEPRGGPAPDKEQAAALVAGFCDQVDNFLYTIHAAREKQKITLALSHALRAPVLANGLASAAEILSSNVAVDRLLLVYAVEQDGAGRHGPEVHVQLYRNGALELDSATSAGSELGDPRAILAEARRYFTLGDRDLARRVGMETAGALEEVLSLGGASGRVVGKLLATPRSGRFSTHDRDLIADFADFILQRVVDWSKEWRTLARSFRPADVSHLLQTPGYQTLLEPRDELVAILFADLSGFTRISEQVLVDPARIGALVDTWGRETVDLTWAEGGVFDKMVGDCLIALFGPPFYETPPGERLAAALRAAREIVRVTGEMPTRPGLERLAGSGIGVSIGVNLAPLFVGRFGPNDNFTGFSAGMNNTARLQHCASRNEILVFDDAIAQLPPGHGLRFGEERQQVVKNVAQPLRFRALQP